MSLPSGLSPKVRDFLAFDNVMKLLEDCEPEAQILSATDVGRITVAARALTGEYPECPHVVFKVWKVGEKDHIETESLKEALYHLGIVEPPDEEM